MRLLLDASIQLRWSPYNNRQRHTEAHLECVARAQTAKAGAICRQGEVSRGIIPASAFSFDFQHPEQVRILSDKLCNLWDLLLHRPWQTSPTVPWLPCAPTSAYHIHKRRRDNISAKKQISLLRQWLHHIWTERVQESHWVKQTEYSLRARYSKPFSDLIHLILH